MASAYVRSKGKEFEDVSQVSHLAKGKGSIIFEGSLAVGSAIHEQLCLIIRVLLTYPLTEILFCSFEERARQALARLVLTMYEGLVARKAQSS
jgi:hypothetical protein